MGIEPIRRATHSASRFSRPISTPALRPSELAESVGFEPTCPEGLSISSRVQ